MLPITLKIGDFNLDVASGTLTGPGRSAKLEPKTVDVLVCLASHQGELVTRDQLIESVWQGRFVTESQISKRIAEIRQALGDDHSPRRFVETLPKRGYRLICESVALEYSHPEDRLLKQAAQETKSQQPRRHTLQFVSALVAILVILYSTQYATNRSNTLPPADSVTPEPAVVLEEPSLAVLPFIDVSSSQDQEYLADGMTDELLHLFAQNQGLRVISRTSSFYYKGNDFQLSDIADSLNVDFILEGSVGLFNDRLRVSAQLIDAQQDAHIWSQSFDREFNDIFAIQNEIAAAVVDRFEVSVLNAPAQAAPIINSEAYNTFLRARYFSRQQTPQSRAEAIAHYQQVLELEPEHAPALANLGLAYIDQVLMGEISTEQAQELSALALNRALEIDPSYALAHVGLAFQLPFTMDFASSVEHFARAIELEPNNDEITFEAAVALFTVYDFENAIQILRELESRDPVNPIIQGALARVYASAGDWQASADSARTALQLSPNHNDAPFNLGLALLAANDHDAALVAFQQDQRAEGRQGVVLAHHALGNLTEFETEFALLIEEWQEASPSVIAEVYAYLGETEQAFEWLNQALNLDIRLLFIHTSPLLVSLHDDPRWQELLTTMGTSEEQLRPLATRMNLNGLISR